MKKIYYMLLNLLMLPTVVLADNGGEQIIDECSGQLGSGVVDVLNWVYTGTLIAVPILVIVLVMKDMVSAVAAGDDKAIKQAQTNAIKRIIIGVVIFFVPILIKAILNIAGITGC